MRRFADSRYSTPMLLAATFPEANAITFFASVSMRWPGSSSPEKTLKRWCTCDAMFDMFPPTRTIARSAAGDQTAGAALALLRPIEPERALGEGSLQRRFVSGVGRRPHQRLQLDVPLL